MKTFRPRSLLVAGAMLLGIGALAVPALCQERVMATPTLVMAQAERPLPVRIDPAGRYLIVAPGTASKAPDPVEAQRIHDGLERQGFRMVHERKATAQSMADSVTRLVENGVRPENISVLAMGDDVQTLIDVAAGPQSAGQLHRHFRLPEGAQLRQPRAAEGPHPVAADGKAANRNAVLPPDLRRPRRRHRFPVRGIRHQARRRQSGNGGAGAGRSDQRLDPRRLRRRRRALTEAAAGTNRIAASFVY